MELPRLKTKGPQYIPLDQIISLGKLEAYKCDIEIKNKSLFVQGRKIPGFTIDKNQVILEGYHFTSREDAIFVRQYRTFSPSDQEDPYSYFIETGFNKIDPKEIRHLSGAGSAEVKFIVPTHRISLKVQKDHPIKYAITNGLEADEIIEISVERIS